MLFGDDLGQFLSIKTFKFSITVADQCAYMVNHQLSRYKNFVAQVIYTESDNTILNTQNTTKKEKKRKRHFKLLLW